METFKNGLTGELTETAPCCFSLKLTVPAAHVSKTYSDVFKRTAANASLPGFRKGHVPQRMIKSTYGAAIKEETSQRLVDWSISEFFENRDMEIAGNFNISGDKAPLVEEGSDLAFEVTFEAYPQYEIPAWKGLKVGAPAAVVTDEEVEQTKESFLRSRGSYKEVTRPVEAGDMVKVTYTSDAPEEITQVKSAGYLLSGDNSWQILREPEMLPGVTNALVGASAGESRDADITFPENFRVPELAGKTIPFHFTVNEVHGFTAPELTPELFRDLGVESLEDLAKMVRTRLEEQANRSREAKLMEQLVEQITAMLTFDVPPAALAKESHDMVKGRIENLRASKKSEEEIAQELPAIEAEAKEEVTKNLRFSNFLGRIARAENVSVSNEDLVNFCIQMSRQTGGDINETIAAFRKNREMVDNAVRYILRQKALKLVFDAAEKGENTPAAE